MKTIANRNRIIAAGATAALVLLAITASCARKPKTQQRGDIAEAAVASYVAPGDLDEYYIFYSGGQSGNVYVAGLPSMRHIATIPVFTPYPGNGYGFDNDTKAMLGGFTWGDVHHPAISKTNGDYDARWLFVNDNANNRMARIDLRDFKTRQVFGPIPNVSGNHGSTFVTNNTEYILGASRFSIPLPKGTYAPIEDYATKYKGVVSGMAVDPKTGQISMGWQIVMPPFDWDLGAGGKGPSEGWAFWTCYNAERGTGKLEVTSTQRDRDYIAAVNWREAEKAEVSLRDLRKDMDKRLSEIKVQVDALQERAAQKVTDQPILALGVAFVAGMALGVALSRSGE
jgi:nitrous-oxide reductase